MATLIPASFRDLVTRLHREPQTQGTLFELPLRNWYRPGPDQPDLSVGLYGARAGNPGGPAAGPHTQMAQNILLSYVAGGRILELRTVQAADHMTTPRPCIDAANVGYTDDWLPGLRIEDSLREYVAGAMLVEMFRRSHEISEGRLDGLAGAVIYDAAVGYDLAGIRRDKVRGFLDDVRSAGAVIDRLRGMIPREFAWARGLHYAVRLAESVTLATARDCAVEEIEKICELLIAEHDFDVTIRLDPSLLGRQRLEHLLYDALGYTELCIDPHVYAAGPTFDEAVGLCERLTGFAAHRGRRVGFKFCNTLEVRDHTGCGGPDGRRTYLAAQPLHVIALTLADEFRRRVGPHVPISLSAGIDRTNFAAAVACGFVPVAVTTDLLQPGGYARLRLYLLALARELRTLDAFNIDEFILRRFGQEAEARRRAAAELGTVVDEDVLHQSTVHWAGLLNTSIVAETAREDPRYRAAFNRSVPPRVESRLQTFDCIACGRCIPVCPNAANFTYPTPVVEFEYEDVIVTPDGRWRAGPTRQYEIARDTQIACYADFCDECANCDIFCPERGAPCLDKPCYHGSVESWDRAAPRDGFVVQERPQGGWILARIGGAVYQLTYANQTQQFHYDDSVVEAVLSGWGHHVISVRPRATFSCEHRLDLGVYHTLRYLRAGVLDPHRVNPVNVRLLSREHYASGTPARE